MPTIPPAVEGVCPSSDWVDFGSYCYYFSTMMDTQNWQMAVASCASKAGYFTTGNLASIHSPAENQFIYDKLKPIGMSSAWIGLYKEAQGTVGAILTQRNKVVARMNYFKLLIYSNHILVAIIRLHYIRELRQFTYNKWLTIFLHFFIYLEQLSPLSSKVSHWIQRFVHNCRT